MRGIWIPWEIVSETEEGVIFKSKRTGKETLVK